MIAKARKNRIRARSVVRKKIAIRLEKPEVVPDCVGGNTPARGALKVALLDQIGFEYVFDGVTALTNGRCEVVESDWPTAEFLQHGTEQLAIHHVEAELVDLKHRQRGIGHLGSDFPA